MSTFRGIDPDGLAGLGRELARSAAAVLAAANEVHAVLARHERWGVADTLGSNLSRVARGIDDEASEMAWRSEAIRLGQSVTYAAMPSLVVARMLWEEAEFAAVARFGIADRGAAFEQWRSGPPIAGFTGRAVAEVVRRFANLPSSAADRLLTEHPAVVGALDGAPPALRVAANDMLIAREVSRLADHAATLRDEIRQLEAGEWAGSTSRMLASLERDVYLADLERAESRLAMFGRWLAEDRQFLLFDPRGDGRVVEVFGDLARAGHVAVVVPGITNDIDNFSPLDGGGFRANAEQLYHAAQELEPDVATIAWLGYDTPDGADAMLRGAADDGHRHLVAFVDALAAAKPRPHVAVVGHSYGSLVTGMAAGAGLAADDVVFVGSPGTSLDRATAAAIERGGRVWAGLARKDPIGAGIEPAPDSVWEFMLGPIGSYAWDSVTTGDYAAEDLWHGRNPVHDSFDAIEFSTDGATGHSQYFSKGTESLANLARIIAGLDFDVRLVGDRELEDITD